ncbi:MAG: VOC family protein [Acidobacteria bacterium]|nr:VOC family protein [Acidobacteriota bacterium]
MPNQVGYFELMGPDGETQRDFYASLFGWELEAVPGFDAYYTVGGDSIGMGGGVGKGPEGNPSYCAIYIEVDSIDDHLARIEAAGGTTVVPRTVIPDTVIFAMFADPAGNVVGLMESGG